MESIESAKIEMEQPFSSIFMGESEKRTLKKSTENQLSSVFFISKPKEHVDVELYDLGSSKPPTASSVKKVVMDNIGFLAQPIKDVGNEIFNMNRRFPQHKYIPPVEQSVFPRSVIFELDYIKKQYEKKMLNALERERQAVAEKLKQKGKELQQIDAQNHQNNNSNMMNKEDDREKPFWYVGESNVPASNINDYDIKYLEPKIEMDKPKAGEDGYTPGEIWKEGTDEPSQPTYTCESVWKPRDPNFNKEFVPEPIPWTNQIGGDEVTTEGRGQGGGFDKATTVREGAAAEGRRFGVDCSCRANDLTCQCQKGCQCQSRVDHLVPYFPLNGMGKRRQLIKHGPVLPPNYVFGKTDYKGNPAEPWPEHPPRLMKPWDDHLRLKEFMSVGLPFKKDACRWQECNIPFFDPQIEKEDIKRSRVSFDNV